MAKKVTPLAKDSKHPFSGETVYFATKHSKEKALAPLLAQIEMKCIGIDVDTSQ